MRENDWTRRQALLAGLACGLWPMQGYSDERVMIRRPIPVSGEQLPVIGLGTYEVFDVKSTPDAIASRQAIVDLLLGEGGSVIDSSPMYNRSEQVVGDIIKAGSPRESMFIATKVWTNGHDSGLAQMRRSAELLSTRLIDLMQVHNLRDTATQMASIRELQQEGLIRYNGLTHYTARAYGELESQMRKFRPEFIQVNYSLAERSGEDRILPAAQELGIAVLVNRPYQAGRLFSSVSGRALPDWAASFAASWGQFFLKFIIAHPAVTCVIPATSKLHHMADNLEAGFGRLPDDDERQLMIRFLESL